MKPVIQQLPNSHISIIKARHRGFEIGAQKILEHHGQFLMSSSSSTPES